MTGSGWAILDWLASLTGTTVGAVLYGCRTFDPWMVLTILTSDFLIGASYFVIGGTFFGFVTRAQLRGWSIDRIRLTIAEAFSPPLLLMLGLFILACGGTHWAHDLVILFGPSDQLEAASRLPTMLVSVVTAVMVVRAFWRVPRR